jgi:hypothetical protein
MVADCLTTLSAVSKKFSHDSLKVRFIAGIFKILQMDLKNPPTTILKMSDSDGQGYMNSHTSVA